ncbi:serine hydroxymethyltransferase [Candidatus Woesearchaeota archaeon]|nr:serine hydroxymethyltransferase [Candidatus Woesearchaeota archaeon]
MLTNVAQQDPEILMLLQLELSRQRNGLMLIPSENFASLASLEAAGTVLTNKYAEGYPTRRYYTGNKVIDKIEQLAIDRAKKLFQAEHANVQPNAGSTANQACYNAVLKPGDKILGMNLGHGGHLTHGNPVNFSGKTYSIVPYGVNQETEMLDMDEIRKIALKEKPKLVLSGATAYPRKIDFKAFQEIAYEVDAYCMADISHIVGLCLAGLHQNPVPSHDIVMTTTHKTLRGTRGAIILCKQEDRLKHLYDPEGKKNLAEKIDFSLFPGLQGGPLQHIIAAKAVCFAEAMKPEFKTYQEQIVKNAKALAESLINEGVRVVSNGTDNHLILIDCRSVNCKGKEGANTLEELGIYTNFNMIPFDTGTPFNPSGIRLGTPALTSRGMKESEMKEIGSWIATVLKNLHNDHVKEKIRNEVLEMTRQFPLYPELEY